MELVDVGLLHSLRKLIENPSTSLQIKQLVIDCYSNVVTENFEIRDNLLNQGIHILI